MVKPIVSAINNLKAMGGGHAVHERQAILSTTVVISHTFCTENQNELTQNTSWTRHQIVCIVFKEIVQLNYTEENYVANTAFE